MGSEKDCRTGHGTWDKIHFILEQVLRARLRHPYMWGQTAREREHTSKILWWPKAANSPARWMTRTADTWTSVSGNLVSLNLRNQGKWQKLWQTERLTWNQGSAMSKSPAASWIEQNIYYRTASTNIYWSLPNWRLSSSLGLYQWKNRQKSLLHRADFLFEGNQQIIWVPRNRLGT